jgi:hypothetical protein
MRNRGRHALATEAVERPHEQQVELASRCAGEHCCELISVLGVKSDEVREVLARRDTVRYQAQAAVDCHKRQNRPRYYRNRAACAGAGRSWRQSCRGRPIENASLDELD